MTSLRGILRRCRSALLATRDTPRHAALSLACGVFLSFSPLLGFQIAIAVVLASTTRLNRVLLFVGLCANLPWLCPFYYAAVTEGAAWLMGTAAPTQLAAHLVDILEQPAWSRGFWRDLLLLVRPLFWPFVVGSFLTAGALALLAYGLGLTLASGRGQPAGEH